VPRALLGASGVEGVAFSPEGDDFSAHPASEKMTAKDLRKKT
jgi:hypothetical protein